ncbi:hypothetical protein BH10PSE14_BH10PSE14_04790 [soil metagenome]
MAAGLSHLTVSRAKATGRPSDRGRFLRIDDVMVTVGLGRTSIYRLMAADEFPKQRQLTKRCIGWWEADIAAWLEQRCAAPA